MDPLAKLKTRLPLSNWQFRIILVFNTKCNGQECDPVGHFKREDQEE